MKKVEGFRMRSLGLEHIIVPEDVRLVNFNKMISLNESAAYLWESVGEGDFTVEDLTGLLLDKYEVESEKAAADASALAKSWLQTGLVTE